MIAAARFLLPHVWSSLAVCASFLSGAVNCVSLACPCSYHQSRRGGLYVPVVGEPRRLICSLCLFSSSHHLVRRYRLRFHPRHVPVSHRSPWLSLFSSGGRLSCGERRALPIILFPFSYELGKTVHDWIARSSLSDVPWLLVSLLVVPSRGTSRAVSSSWRSLVAGVGSCVSARWRLVMAGRPASVLRRGGVLAFILHLSSRPLLVIPSRPSSRCSFPMSFELGRCGVLARLIVAVLLVGRCLSLCRGVLSCLPVSSDLLFSCRRVWRSFSSRGASRCGVVVDGLPVAVALRACGSRGCVSSCRLVERGRFGFSFHPGGSGWAAVPVLPSRGRCLLAPASSGDVAMPFSPVPYHPMDAGYGLRAVSSIVFVVCFLFPGLSLSSRFACLVRDDGTEDGRRGGGMLGYRGGARHDLSIDVYNKYDVCDVYKRYKNTRIREYDGYIGRCRWDDSDAACYAGR